VVRAPTRRYLAGKRALDLVVGTLLLVIAIPVIAVCALAIRLDTPGPMMYAQLRTGRDGRRFRMLKLRTMLANAEELKPQFAHLSVVPPPDFKIPNDPRITRVGRFLRATSLDELPQLFNVLRGEMSLVGPRPLVLDEDEQVAGWHRRRLDLTPGMTGAWQILGNRVPLEDMVSLDYLYIVNWSLWSDIEILLRTVPHVLGRRNR
jgi:lipopolysaccharide/colanic/teichoic acid biosynthesis glycosyltransferase